jgi:hypothetical protein
MTTKVKIELLEPHTPVIVEVLRDDGIPRHVCVLREKGSATEEYVHSGQTLRVREMTTQEMHDERIPRAGG